MNIEYSIHAEKQIKEREMGKEIIEEILQNPQQTVKGKKNREIAQSIIELGGFKFLFRVIFIEEKSAIKVLTAYKTTNIEKYWVKK